MVDGNHAMAGSEPVDEPPIEKAPRRISVQQDECRLSGPRPFVDEGLRDTIGVPNRPAAPWKAANEAGLDVEMWVDPHAGTWSWPIDADAEDDCQNKLCAGALRDEVDERGLTVL
jgi:hypothetical protein